MNYYFSKIINKDFIASKALISDALKSEGFGLVSEIDMQEKFKEKLGVDFKKYTILGACNPAFAYKAVQAEEKIGTMLPCNIILIDQGGGNTEITAIDPIASMMAIENIELQPLAEDVSNRLKRIIESLK